jgi:hypothetical protein
VFFSKGAGGDPNTLSIFSGVNALSFQRDIKE